LIDVCLSYIEKFPVYNTLSNCQHFSYNTFNLFTEGNINYEAAAIMGINTDASTK